MMDLEKLKALADAATPGPWRVRQDGSASWLCQPDQSGLELKDSAIRLPMKRSHDDRERNRLDALFIAAAREAVPALIAEVERLRVESARLTSDLVNMQETARNYAALFHRERNRRRALLERIVELSADADDASGP